MYISGMDTYLIDFPTIFFFYKGDKLCEFLFAAGPEAESDARPTGDQEVEGPIPARSGSILS